MEISQRFRRAVAPLNIVASLEVVADSAHSPAIQTTDGSTCSPDRSEYPTVVRIRLLAASADGTANYDITSSVVTNIQWYVQGSADDSPVKIGSHSAWTADTDYTIDNTTAKGQITIKKNLVSSSRYVLSAKFDIVDSRSGSAVTTPVQTDGVLLYSVLDCDEQYSMAIDRPTGETYDPILDKQLLYEWLVGHGYSAEEPTDDGNGHLRTVNVQLRKGGKLLTADTDYTIKVYAIDSEGNETESTADNDDCIKSISGGAITFDLLFAVNGSYRIAALVGDNEVYHRNYGWFRADSAPTIPLGGGVIAGATYGDGSYQTCKTQMMMAGSAIEHPECAMTLDWYARKVSTDTFRGSGEQYSFDLTDSAMFASGSSEGTGICKVDRRDAAQYLTDEDGDAIVDEDGNRYYDWQ